VGTAAKNSQVLKNGAGEEAPFRIARRSNAVFNDM
jgi:hypothetical protein